MLLTKYHLWNFYFPRYLQKSNQNIDSSSGSSYQRSSKIFVVLHIFRSVSQFITTLWNSIYGKIFWDLQSSYLFAISKVFFLIFSSIFRFSTSSISVQFIFLKLRYAGILSQTTNISRIVHVFAININMNGTLWITKIKILKYYILTKRLKVVLVPMLLLKAVVLVLMTIRYLNDLNQSMNFHL